MKVQLPLLLLIISIQSFAQSLARIEDKDGYVNVRKTPDSKGEIIDKLGVEDIFYVLEKAGDWYEVPSPNPAHVSGYVHQSRVRLIDDFTPITLTKIQPGSAIFQKDSIKVQIRTKPFNESANNIEYQLEDEHKRVSRINGKVVWGIFYNMPKMEYESVEFAFGKKSQGLPKEAIANLYQPNLDQTKANFDSTKNILYIRASNSDGAGGYEVLWIIKNGMYAARKIFGPF